MFHTCNSVPLQGVGSPVMYFCYRNTNHVSTSIVNDLEFSFFVRVQGPVLSKIQTIKRINFFNEFRSDYGLKHLKLLSR